MIHRVRFASILGWLAAGLAGAALAVGSFPRAFPLFPSPWETSRDEAEAIALERLRDLGELPASPYVVTVVDEGAALEERLQRALPAAGAERVRASPLADELLAWVIRVYAPGASSAQWNYRARIRPDGKVTELRMSVPAEEGGGQIAPEEAVRLAAGFLRDEGVDLGRYEPPEVRSEQLATRTDRAVRFRDRERLLGETVPYGIEVSFAGDRLAGFSTFVDDPERAALQRQFQAFVLVNQSWVFLVLVLLPVVAIPFVRRYHAGEIGVRRGVQIAAVVVALGVVVLAFSARGAGAGWQIGVLTRRQVTWVAAFELLLLFFFPMGLMAFLSWSVGESFCRERWGARLAAFDAFCKGDWANATVARAALRGTAAGALVLGALWGLAALLRGRGVWAMTSWIFEPWWSSAAWFAFPLLGMGLAHALYTSLFGRLLLVSAGARYLGVGLGSLVAAGAASLLFFPSMIVFPFAWNLLFWALPAAVFAALFLRYGLLTSFLAALVAGVAGNAVPLLMAADPGMQAQAALALVAAAAPFLATFRSLLSPREFVYRYDEIPPHVRRIAERERQRVELETARGIQSAILPDLPARLNGVELAHRYLPATEVGGDFYDVLALGDGRLAVAVGDVAGHGVSSGLVMSMAKSALAVQVTFDPEVESVFATLNRMVYQSARRRLLTTLCYALLDPARRTLRYASAGHLFPYRVTASGSALALESVSYPLGVRDHLEVRVGSTSLAAGDTLVLFSDGIVEAHAEGSDELYGFDRLEQSLKRHAGDGPEGLRDGVLADLERFTRGAPREDDLTLLVLRLP